MKQKIHSTTQNFIEIESITNNIVFLKGGNSCIVLDVASINFYLLSQEERESRIYGFMSLLNSLTFPIQILIVSKSVDISSYLTLVDQRLAQESRPQIARYLKHYKEFVQSLVKSRKLLNKKFYLVIPFSQLELGAVGNMPHTGNSSPVIAATENALLNKKTAIMTQLQRSGLSSHQLTGEKLTKLFYEMFNQEVYLQDFNIHDAKNIIL